MFTKRRVRWLLALLLTGMGSLIGYYLLSSTGYEVGVGDFSVFGTDADLRIARLHVVQNKDGAKNWEMWADTAKVYRAQNITRLKNLRLRLYPRGGRPADVVADWGVMENKSRNIAISGNVVLRAADGTTLRTDSLRFRPGERNIATDAPIRIEGKAFILTGIGLRGRTDTGEYVLKRQVSAVIYDNAALAARRRAALAASGQGGEAPEQRSLPR